MFGQGSRCSSIYGLFAVQSWKPQWLVSRLLPLQKTRMPNCLSTTNGCNLHCSKRSFLRFWHLPKIADSSPTSLTTALSKSRGASTPFCCKTPKQVLSEQHLTMWCKWSVQMQHLQVSGFHPLWGETPFLLWVPCRQAVFFYSGSILTSSRRSQGRFFLWIQRPFWASLLLKGLEQTYSKIQETCVQMQHVYLNIYIYISAWKLVGIDFQSSVF